ncbi:IS1634 family transposase, partial [Heliomicrobium undosum]
YENTDLDLIFGPSALSLDALHDRHFGLLLDRMYEANPQHVFDMVSTVSVVRHGIDLRHLHSDTTSQSVYGAYEGEGELSITYGYSKDGRPDLKQFLYGLVVAEGVPVAGKVMNGNQSDKTWNRDVIDELAGLVAHHVSQKVMYIADSALVTFENLKRLHDVQMLFVTRLPGTYQLTKTLKLAAEQANDWTNVGAISDKPDAATYRLWETTDELDGRTYRFFVIHSSSLAGQKAGMLERQAKREKEALEKAATKLQKHLYACEADAQAARAEFLSAYATALHSLSANVVAIQQEKTTRGRGRRPAGFVPEYETKWQVCVTVGDIDKARLAAAQRKEETFILMTNDTTEDAVEILRRYKGQITVENRFRWLKDPAVVDQIWLKTPNRIMALGYVFLIGLLIYSLLERRLRQNMARETKPIRLPGNRLSKSPTAASFMQLFSDVVILINPQTDGTVRRVMPRRFDTPELRRAAALAGIEFTRFTLPPEVQHCNS